MSDNYIHMKEITKDDYIKFIKERSSVIIEDVEIKLNGNWNIKSYGPPEDYTPERTTVWSFPERGNWATHRGDYRGNWSPYIPRNLILKYTNEGDWVLDQMMGSGTTLVEAKLLKRNAKNQFKTTIHIDVSQGILLAERVVFPDHRSEYKELERGRLLFYVTFKGGKAYLDVNRFYEMIGLSKGGEEHDKHT